MSRVLHLPAFRRLFIAYSLNELALSIGSVALAVLVYQRTGSVIGAAAFFLCAQFLPALLSPAVVARLDQRAVAPILPTLYLLEGAAYLLLAWIAPRFALAPVLAIALIDGVLAVTARALARAATVTVTSPVGLLRDANALTNGAFSICYMVGPAIGGALVVAGGTSAALLTNCGLFALITLTLTRATGLPAAATQPMPSAGRLRAALGHAASHRAIRVLLSLQAAALLFFTLSIPVEVVFAQHSLHAGAGGYGGLLTAWGGGALAGSLIYARWRSLPARILITAGAGALGVGFVVMAGAPNLAIALVGSAVAGCGNGIEAIAAQTALQEHVERGWMAMMMSLNESLSRAVPGVGIVLGGAIASLASPRTALAVAGGGALVITVVAWVVLTPQGALASAAEDPPAAAPEPRLRRAGTVGR